MFQVELQLSDGSADACGVRFGHAFRLKDTKALPGPIVKLHDRCIASPEP